MRIDFNNLRTQLVDDYNSLMELLQQRKNEAIVEGYESDITLDVDEIRNFLEIHRLVTALKNKEQVK